MLSQLVIIANYLHPLVSSKNHEKMDKVSLACLLNEAAHACAKANNLSLEVADLRRENAMYLEAIEVFSQKESLIKENLLVKDETLMSLYAMMAKLEAQI
ncbi:hypothetical protein HAX54_038930 [Datura stramonium]|uniref:Rho-GAP domain-containing protein n=1 Tax=Datura stramonium TaxID=4076 RepID=A0ABS8VLW1_DATST|nr:hypothetical protein [Datura stramonium]